MFDDELDKLKKAIDELGKSVNMLVKSSGLPGRPMIPDYCPSAVEISPRPYKDSQAPCKGPFIGPHIGCECVLDRRRIEYDCW